MRGAMRPKPWLAACAEYLRARLLQPRDSDRGRRMKIVYFARSLQSCWNHGNAHFLRGVLSELIARGHEDQVLGA